MKEILQQQKDQGVSIFDKSHIKRIVYFQIEMALQLENTQLNRKMVESAVEFLIDHQQFGFYLVKQSQTIAIGQLLVSALTRQAWWFASVYIDLNHRSKGYFRSLFKKLIEMAKQKDQSTQKIMWEWNNRNSNKCMKNWECIEMDKDQFEEKYHGQVQLLNGEIPKTDLTQYKDLLCNHSPSTTRQLHVIKNSEIVGVIFYFTEFSQWLFGLISCIQSLYMKKNCTKEEIANMHIFLCHFFKDSSPLRTISMRYIINEKSQNVTQIIQGGKMQPYEVMEMKL